MSMNPESDEGADKGTDDDMATSGDEVHMTEPAGKSKRVRFFSNNNDLVWLTVLPKIPLPRRFSPPRGGAAPVEIRMQPSQSNQGGNTEEDSMQQPSTSVEASSTAVPRPRRKSSKKGAAKVFGDDNISEEAMVRCRKRNLTKIFPETPRRGCNAINAARMVGLYSSRKGRI
jgi:hypothetical protein